jgi:hypothetical protein
MQNVNHYWWRYVGVFKLSFLGYTDCMYMSLWLLARLCRRVCLAIVLFVHLKATEHDKFQTIAGSIWLSLFMGRNWNACYCPSRLAPGWAWLNINTNLNVWTMLNGLSKMVFTNSTDCVKRKYRNYNTV